MSDLFTVVDLDDPATIRSRANALARTYAEADRAYSGTTGAWSALRGQYHAPEGEEVHGALARPQTVVGALADAASQASSALSAYADRLEDIAQTRRTLLAEISSFHQECFEGADADGTGAREAAISRLQHRCHTLAQAKDAAQNQCAQQLGAVSTGSAESRDSSEVPTADESTDLDPSSRRVFDDPVVDRSVRIIGHGLTGIGVGLQVAIHQRTALAVREAWPPRRVQNLVTRLNRGNVLGRLGAGGLATRALGWNPANVTNGGRWMSRTDPRNPYRPLPARAGFGARTAAVARRTVANLRTSNRRPLPGQSDGVRRLRTASTWVGRAGNVLTAGTSAYGQWQADSRNHPDMGVTERTVRSGVQGGATAVGGAVGAKGGAALGAAIGSVVPGVGTVVGGVAGGIIGGIAGSELGSRGGAAVNRGISNAKDKVKGWFGR